jgi:hypothetical protein
MPSSDQSLSVPAVDGTAAAASSALATLASVASADVASGSGASSAGAGSGGGFAAGSGSGSSSSASPLSAAPFSFALSASAPAKTAACPITRCPLFAPPPFGCTPLVPIPAQRSLGLRLLTPPIDGLVADDFGEEEQKQKKKQPRPAAAAIPVPFQADVQDSINQHGAVVVEQAIVGRPLFLGQQLFSGLAATAAKLTVLETQLGEVQLKPSTLLENKSVVARINELRRQGQATGFVSLQDYDEKIAQGTALSAYPTDLAGVDPYEAAAAAAAESAAQSPHRPELVHSHPQSLLRCLSWAECQAFEGFSGQAYAYLKLGADCSSWHREQLDGDTLHEQVAGTSLIMQVMPGYLPQLEAAMADRVKASLGIADLDPGAGPRFRCSLLFVSDCFFVSSSGSAVAGALLRQAATNHGRVAGRTR